MTWPAHVKIGDRPLVRGLFADGFDGADGMIPEDAKIDPFIPPAEMLHIVDSDSSQALALHEVRRGRDMVIQGPPGTGKSQTIANIVASAVADGKTVLFVAEKMAALEVVKRRLDATGVGDACLELHSNKANKRALLDELRRTWELGAPRGADPGSLHARLTEARDRLNGHAARMHRPHPIAGLSPYQVIGQLVRLEVITRVERRRRYSDEERAAVLAQCDEPGATVVGVSRRLGISSSLIHGWRKARREAERMIRILYEVERGITRDPHDDRRKARKLSKLTALDFCVWADDVLGQVSARTPLAEALRYAVRLKPALLAYTENGRLEIDNNPAENALRGIAVGRKNWMFAGADCGGERAAPMYSLLETAKLNGINPQEWLADLLDRVGQGHTINRLDELLPWNWTAPTAV